MKQLFKRSATVLLVLVLIFSMTAMSVSAFTPPGLAKKMVDVDAENLPQQGWARWFGWRFLESEDDEYDLEGLPPGIAKKGIPLPPGLMRFVDEPDKLPPGIWNRFMERWQERERDDDKEREVTEVRTRRQLMNAVRDKAEEIKLMNDIEITETLVINWKLNIDGNNKTIEAEEDFDGWMFEVTNNGRLMLFNLRLDGYYADDDDFEGFVTVAKGGELKAEGNELYYAPIGFELWVDEDDFDDQDEIDDFANDLITDQDIFSNVTDKVVIRDGSKILFP